MLSTPPEGWDLRVPDDRRSLHHFRGGDWSFDELVALRKDENLAAQIEPRVWRERHAACRRAIEVLAEVYRDAAPDVAVLIGNDQMEVFDDTLIPAFSIMWGDKIANTMYSDERFATLPPGIGVSVSGHIPPGGGVYPGAPDLGRHIIEHVGAQGFDLAAMTAMPKQETPHAFGFVYRQIMKDKPVPSVPVMINTFYPPNQPSLSRCAALGAAIARAVRSWDSSAKVALIASGGLTHFVIDETVDKIFLDALKTNDFAPLIGLGEAVFQAGTSEIKNWIPVAGAMAELGLAPTIVDYVPCYRTEAGTGNAMGFVYWRP
jgi:hypothetical protein